MVFQLVACLLVVEGVGFVCAIIRWLMSTWKAYHNKNKEEQKRQVLRYMLPITQIANRKPSVSEWNPAAECKI